MMAKETEPTLSNTVPHDNLESESDIPDAQSDHVTVQIDLSSQAEEHPLQVNIASKIYERIVDTLDRKGIQPKTIGKVVVFAASTAVIGWGVKKYIEKKQQKEEKPDIIPLLSPEKKQEFSEMYESWHLPIYYFTRARIDDPYIASDLASETFLRALEKFPKYVNPPQGKPYKAWLFQIAHNVIYNHKRDTFRHKTDLFPETTDDRDSFVDSIPSEITSLEGITIQNEWIDTVNQALSDLSPRTRDNYITILWLKTIQQLSNKEIAYILESNEGAVKSKYFRINEKLNKVLEEKNETMSWNDLA